MDLRTRLRAGALAGVLATMTMDGAMTAAAALSGEALSSERLPVR